MAVSKQGLANDDIWVWTSGHDFSAIFNAKSKLGAYICWFLFGWIGGHKLYLRQYFEFLLYFGLTVGGAVVSFSNLEEITFANISFVLVGFMLFIDIFRIPFSVKRTNAKYDKKISKRNAKLDAARQVEKAQKAEAKRIEDAKNKELLNAELAMMNARVEQSIKTQREREAQA